MNRIIKAIFYNSTCGVEYIKMPQSAEYDRINKKEDALYGQLKAAVSPELAPILDEFIIALLDRYALISEQHYVAGFKVGLRLGMETVDLSDIFDI